MKVGVGTTPAAGTPVARGAAPLTTPLMATATPPSGVTRVRFTTPTTPPPVLTPPPVMTPPPVLRAERPRRPTGRQVPLRVQEDARAGRSRAALAGLAGLLLIAFSCGMMFMVAVDRLWPRARAQCEGVPAETTAAAAPAPRAVEPVRDPAPEAARIAEVPALSPAASRAPVRVEPRVVPTPPRVPEPISTVRPAPAARPAPTAHVAPPPVPARTAAVAAPVAQGRAVVRKRASLAAQGEAPPTEAWTDPFAQ